MKRNRTTTTLMVLGMAAFSGAMLSAVGTPAQDAATMQKKARVERGAYLVGMMGCNDCHTPWKVGSEGPEPDMTRALRSSPGHGHAAAAGPVGSVDRADGCDRHRVRRPVGRELYREPDARQG